MGNTEIKHFTMATSEDYGDEWSKAVLEYLDSGYANNEPNCEVTVGNTKYKVLKRNNVTAFYDEGGNTLFDIENERLASEYEAFEKKEEAEENNADTNIEKETASDQVETAQKSSESKEEDNKEGENEGAVQSDVSDNEDNGKKAEQAGTPEDAKKKLEDELKKAKNKDFADPIIKYLLKRVEESSSLAADICQPNKNWDKCYAYIYSQARNQTKGNSCAVRDDVVYEWAEDYFHKEEKEINRQKAVEKAVKTAVSGKSKDKPKTKEEKAWGVGTKKTENKKKPDAKQTKEKVEVPKNATTSEKPKKNKNEMDGQMDLFSLMGM